jgi:type VI secretion system protein ImpF
VLERDLERCRAELEALLDARTWATVTELATDDHRRSLTLDGDERARLGAPAGDVVQRIERLLHLEQARRFERRGERTQSLARLRDAVVRDLFWLLSTESLSRFGVDDMGDEVADSVLNYGIPPFVGGTLSDVRGDKAAAVTAEIRKAVIRFEPRIRPETLVVRPLGDAQGDPRQLRLQVEAELMVEPAPVRLLVDTVFDVEEGQVRVEASR